MKILNSILHGLFESLVITLVGEFGVYLMIFIEMNIFIHSTALLSFRYIMSFMFMSPFNVIVIILSVIMSIIFYFKNYAAGGRH